MEQPDQLRSFAPPQSYKWLRKLLPRRMQPLARGLRKRIQRMSLNLQEPYYTVFPYTQVAQVKQQNLVRLAQFVDDQKVEGAIVECGVLDGGTAALMAWASRRSRRAVHLFDSWQGLPDSTEEDGSEAAQWVGDVVGSPKRVSAVMGKLGIDATRVHFHHGWFTDTFPQIQIDQIALLHIDPDFYAPVKLCLDHWYPRLSPGGYVQLDDYECFSGCNRATDEFLATRLDIKLESWSDGINAAYFFRKPLT